MAALKPRRDRPLPGVHRHGAASTCCTCRPTATRSGRTRRSSARYAKQFGLDLARAGADERHAGARDDAGRRRTVRARDAQRSRGEGRRAAAGRRARSSSRAPTVCPACSKRYGGFTFKQIKTLDNGLKYQALLHGDVDVVVAFSTEGQLKADNLVVLEDDKHLFPSYAGGAGRAQGRARREARRSRSARTRSRRC